MRRFHAPSAWTLRCSATPARRHRPAALRGSMMFMLSLALGPRLSSFAVGPAEVSPQTLEPLPTLHHVHMVLQDTATSHITAGVATFYGTNKIAHFTAAVVKARLERDVMPMIEAFQRAAEEQLKPALEAKGITKWV